MKSKQIALYHSKDADGFTCGMLLKKAGYVAIPYNYGETIPCNLEDIAIIADVSLDVESMVEWSYLRDGAECIWFDHHAPIINDVKTDGRFKGELIESTWGACWSVWNWCTEQGLGGPYYTMGGNIKMLARYDVFDFTWPDDIDPLIHQLGWRTKVPFGTIDSMYWNQGDYYGSGVLILEYLKQQAKMTYDFSYSGFIENIPCRYIMGPCSNPVISLMYPDDLLVFVTLNRSKPNGVGYTYSMRCQRDDIDLGLLAQRFGGGGHAHAAGFRTTKEIWK